MRFFTSRTIIGLKIQLKAAIIATVLEIIIFYVLVISDSLKLLDYSLIVSLVVAEVPIGLFLYYLLGERRRSKIQEVIDLVDAAKKFRHLKLHRFAGFPSVLRTNWYYVENIDKKHAYDCSKNLIQLSKWGIITVIRHRNEEEMKQHFTDNGIKVVEREGTWEELSLV